MPTYFKASDKLLAAYNSANGTSLTASQVKFINPVPADTIDTTKAKTYNTAVTMELLDTAPVQGSVVLFYNRVDLEKEFANYQQLQTEYIPVQGITNTHLLIGKLETKFGLRLSTDDIELYPIALKDDSRPVTIRATPSSMEYYGSFNIRVFNSIAGGSITFLFERVSIHHYPFKTSCINNSYPNVTDTDYTNQVYLTDYTPIANFLSAVRCFGGYSPTNSIELDEQTMLVADQIRLCLNAVDNIGWVYDTAFPITNVTTLPNAYRLLALFNGKPSDFNSFGSESWINYYTQIRHRPGGLLATEVPSPINYGKLADVRYDRVLVLAGDYPWRSPKLYRRVFFLHYNVGALDEYFLRYR